jgi:hypothetical protein
MTPEFVKQLEYVGKIDDFNYSVNINDSKLVELPIENEKRVLRLSYTRDLTNQFGNVSIRFEKDGAPESCSTSDLVPVFEHLRDEIRQATLEAVYA